MCEHCDRDRSWKEPLLREAGADEDEEYTCEWFTVDESAEEDSEAGDEDEGQELEFCGAPARWWVYHEWVEEHLCARHAAEEKRELAGGLGDFLEAVGLSRSVEFLPIKQAGDWRCEHVPPEAMLGEADVQECGRAATVAKQVVDVEPQCDEHAAGVVAQ